MGDSLFDIFGDSIIRQAEKHVLRQPMANVENMGKTVSAGPIKPNEPVKPLKLLGDAKTKKSFLSNTGKALQNTPVRQAFTPRNVNVGSLIYHDAEEDWEDFDREELEFTQASNKLDNYHLDALDYLLPGLQPLREESPPSTPSPDKRHSADLNCSYQDEFYMDDFSCDAFPEDEDEDLDIYN